ncbi:MAG: hypothetical protein IKO82_04675 [Prevotella sp.]|nr:hypothetical protein [Prevotella sp.]
MKKKIYIVPKAEFEVIEEELLFDKVSVESEHTTPETGGQTQGPGGGSSVDDGSELDW